MRLGIHINSYFLKILLFYSFSLYSFYFLFHTFLTIKQKSKKKNFERKKIIFFFKRKYILVREREEKKLFLKKIFFLRERERILFQVRYYRYYI